MKPQTVKRIKVQRLELGVTLEQLAAESGVPIAYISEAERGIRNLTNDQEEKRHAALERLRGAA